ncbi:MAG: hypothetical protein ISR55_08850 [Bacteroidetes bacterium]|nr:hypothetical protein [Bacteroidota bacterium]
MTDRKETHYKAMWILGAVMIPLGLVLLFLGPKKAPLGLILIALAIFYIFTAIRKKKEEQKNRD